PQAVAPAPVADKAPALPVTCDSPRAVTKAFGGTLTIAENKSWRPRGGEFKFTVSVPAPIPEDALIKVCFRWAQDNDPLGGFTEAAGRGIVDQNALKKQPIPGGAPVPALRGAPARTTEQAAAGAKDVPAGIWEGWHTVPVADVRVLVYQSGKAPVYDLQT